MRQNSWNPWRVIGSSGQRRVTRASTSAALYKPLASPPQRPLTQCEANGFITWASFPTPATLPRALNYGDSRTHAEHASATLVAMATAHAQARVM